MLSPAVPLFTQRKELIVKPHRSTLDNGMVRGLKHEEQKDCKVKERSSCSTTSKMKDGGSEIKGM
jgi:hypothetical protein